MGRDTMVHRIGPLGTVSDRRPPPPPHRRAPAYRVRSRNAPAEASGGSRESPATERAVRSEWQLHPTSLFLYGESRPLVNLALFALAHAANPELLWVDVRVPGEERGVADPMSRGWVRPGRGIAIERLSELHPRPAVDGARLAELLRDEADRDRVARFLELPNVTQELLTRTPDPGRPGVVAVTNAHRLMAAYADQPLAPILDAHRSAGYSLFVGYADVPGPGRFGFDYSLRLDGEGLGSWHSAVLECERGAGSGPFAEGARTRLDRLPYLATTFRAALRVSE